LIDTVANSWGFSLFCDDIRAEIGGKISVMGVYQADMIFPLDQEFPLTLPKFGILFKYYETMGAFTEDVAIRVFFPGDSKEAPSIILPFPRASIVIPEPLYPLDEDQQRVFNLSFPVLLAPLVIKQEGFIKVRVVCGDRTTNLGSLMIRKARAEENLLPFGFPPRPPGPAAPAVSG
jgi:hypothetical protein